MTRMKKTMEKIPKLKFNNRGENQTKNIERRDLWRELKSKFVGKGEDFQSRKYKYGNADLIREYIIDAEINKPKENLLKVMKEQAKILNNKLPREEKIKLNLSKNGIKEKLSNLWKNRTEEIFNIFGEIDGLQMREEFANDILTALEKLAHSNDKKYIVELKSGSSTKYITLTKENIEKWKNIIMNRIWIKKTQTEGSDVLDEIQGQIINYLKIKEVDTDKTSSRKYNGFFNFINESDIDLKRYGIYNREELLNGGGENLKSCLIRSLENCNIDNGLISNVVQMFPTAQENFPLSKMRDVANLINKNIIMHYHIENCKKNDKFSYIINKDFETIELAQYKNHIFNFDRETKYSKLYIANKKEIDLKFAENENRFKFNAKNLDNKYSTGNFYFSKPRESYLNSLNLVINMMKESMFGDYAEICSIINKVVINNSYKVEPSVGNIENCQKEVSKSRKLLEMNDEIDGIEKDKSKRPIILYADCETQVNDKTEYHKLLAFCFLFKGEDCVNENCSNKSCNDSNHREIIMKSFKNTGDINSMIAEIKTSLKNLLVKIGAIYYDYKNRKMVQVREVRMFFHNAKYDSKILESHFYSCGEVCKDGNFYSKDYSLCFGVKFKVVDFYKHFKAKLSKAPKTFGIDVEKCPGVNYIYYSPEKMNDHLVSIEEYKEGVKPEDRDALSKIIKSTEELSQKFEYSIIDGVEMFNPVKFYIHYLEFDVILLQKAFEKYKALTIQLLKIDPTCVLTVSSLAFRYAFNNGSFDGCMEVGGSLREFIQKSIRGGRVYVNPKYLKKVIDAEIVDFDGVSLYPSAIERLCREYGLPIGRINSSTESSYDFYQSKSWYVVKILLKKINKTQDNPLINLKDEGDGTANYINEIEKPTIQYVDKITLEDWIKYHEIEYDIIEGVYWEGIVDKNGELVKYNKILGEVIEDLHKKRKTYKGVNEPLQLMCKNISCSIYGKTGTRKSSTQTRFISNEKSKDFIFNNFGLIKEIEDTNFNKKITISTFDKSTSMNYIAGAILSMSKRIMQEVFSISNDLQIPIFYTDTDSIHMLKKDVEPLSNEFRIRHNREIVGEELGQFHNDFAIDGCEKGVISKKFIAVGPKSYIDLIEGVDKITGEIVHDVHARLKGVTEAGRDFQVMKYIEKFPKIKKIYENDKKEGFIQASIKMYETFAKNMSSRFTMNPTDHAPSMVYTAKGIKTLPVGENKKQIGFVDKDERKKKRIDNVFDI